MKSTPLIFVLFLSILFMTEVPAFAQTGAELYLPYGKRILSPGQSTYFIDPQRGSDQNSGTDPDNSWKTFQPVNEMVLSAGDEIEVLSPGTFHESLVLMANGTRGMPVRIKFAPGRYDIYPDNAVRKILHITNTNDSPDKPKSIVFMLDSCQFTKIEGKNANFVLRGKMMETYLNNCTNISIDGISFNYERPTVSELKVISSGLNYADLEIHKDSKFSIKDSLLTWEGEGWSSAPQVLWQILNIQTDHLNRIDIPMKEIRFSLLGGNKVRAYFPATMKTTRFEKGFIYQNRNIERDYAGIFLNRSKNLTLKNIRINYMHGMGVVVQFCENITIDNLVVKPADSSGRTCAAWADILHFAGCKGQIEIANSYLSAANDDAINVHGLYLSVNKIVGPNQVHMQFMHPQTYGFNPYSVGDSIDFIRPESLLPIGKNVVLASTLLSEREVLLTLENPAPTNLIIGDAVENTTATPEVWIHNNTITRIPTRGILLTTRRKSIIEHNNILNTHMHAILVDNDATYWFESGMVKDLTIRKNNFVKCAEPVIALLPENTAFNKTAVHSNISVLKNIFDTVDSRIFSSKSTSNIKIADNIIMMQKPVQKIEELISLQESTPVRISNNKIIQKK